MIKMFNIIINFFKNRGLSLKESLVISGAMIFVFACCISLVFNGNNDKNNQPVPKIEMEKSTLFSFDVKIHYDKLPADKLIKYQYEIMKNYGGAETLEFSSEKIDININKVTATAGELLWHDEDDAIGVKFMDTDS